MLKRLPSKSLLLLSLYFFSFSATNAQCPAGYNQAQLNWDNLDYYYNSGTAAPYGSGSVAYISDVREQTQKFAIGKTWLSIATSSNALVNPGAGLSAENATHTGDLANFTGNDVQYNPSANGQTITIIFNDEVRNTSFTLYDIDGNARIDIDAYNTANVAQNVDVTLQGGTILSITNDNNINTYVSDGGTASLVPNNLNTGSATATINSSIKRIVITVTTVGTDAVFWLSDINACVPGTFPTNYHQGAGGQPFTGPVANQPDYFIATPDNDAVYMVDPATGNARFLFQDASKDYVNSFAYDPYNHILYYISENNSIDANNKTLKKYDFNTGTSSVVIADMSATLNIPTFNMGIESAGAAFYDGALYFGIEGGKYDVTGTSNDRTRETIVWRIDFTGLTPTNAYQVFATDAYLNASNTSVHDWGDFLIKDGMLYNFNTARSGTCGTCYAQSKYHHYNLMTGAATVYNNPSNTPFTGQGGMTWTGDLYYLRDVVQQYNEAGANIGPQYPLTVVDGPYATWVGGTGDASDPFRPKCDFGDAPATYDPNPVSPAVHERSDNIRLGPTWGTEWVKTSAAPGAAAIDDTDEDGVVDERILTPGSSAFYYREVEVFNNSGSNVRLIAWLDYNGNGIFDASEAITPITVPSSPSVQTFDLIWPSFTCTLPVNSYTYMRVRVTSASAAMTTAHATGYFTNGEVEDYRVLVDNFPLGVNLLTFDARTINNKEVTLSWKANEEPGFAGYEVERSADASLWTKISSVNANGAAGVFNYNINDNAPLKGFSYYRLKLKEANGSSRYSGIRSVNITGLSSVIIAPNPARDFANITIQAERAMLTTINVINESGGLVHTRTMLVQPGENKHSLPVSGWPLGTYIVQVMLNGEVTNKRIIVMK